MNWFAPRDGVVILDLNHERGNCPLAESVQVWQLIYYVV